jgi:predicted alpha-1,2-mannosidase
MLTLNTKSSALLLALALFPALCTAASDSDLSRFCNAVQNKTGFIRYPLGMIGAWSTESGEVADIMTRVPRVYPCANAVALRPAKDDWRAAISGDPSMLTLRYRADKPSGATEMAITTSPHVSVFRVSFPAGARNRYLVFDFAKGKVDAWAKLNQWTNRAVARTDNRTIQATIGSAGKSNAYFVIKFSEPCAGSGSIDSSGAVAEGADRAAGTDAAVYARFEAKTVTVAIAESFTSMAKAIEFAAAEFSDFDSVHQRCHSAWEHELARVEMDGPPNSKRMAYTALYTILANIIDGSDGSCYLPYYPRPRSLASSAYWQFIGGFQSCCWDNYRTPYPFLMLGYPEVMTDIVNTYLARYQRDGSVNGNICLFTGPTGDHLNVRFSPVLVAEAYESGVPANYKKLYAALKDNFQSEACIPASFTRLGYVTQPPEGGKACSETLELSTGMHSMAVLANAHHDPEPAKEFLRLSKCYQNVWDGSNAVFRVRNADGGWGPMNYTNWTWNPNPQGLFEGSTSDWMFSVPHDPYGLLALPGQGNFVERVTDYCLNHTWFNDYQYHYPCLLYYAGAANEAQRIIRTSWVPLFDQAVMYEGVRAKPPHNPWQTHYTGNAGWLLCSMLGLYPVPTPPGQFLISSPSLSKAVIHTPGKPLVIEAKDNSPENIYVRSIKVDGAPYPSYMIPAKKLTAGAHLELEMGSDPAHGLGDLYLSASDGFVVKAALVSSSKLLCTIESAVGDATTTIFSRTRPAQVRMNAQPATGWTYDEKTRLLTIRSPGTATLEISR